MIKRIFFAALIFAPIVFIQISGITPAQSAPAGKKKDHVEGELLVKFKGNAYSPKVASKHADLGAIVLNTFENIGGWQHIKLPEGMTTEQGLALYRSMPDCVYAQYNFIYRIDNTPNDPQFPTMYGLAKISAPQAWDTTTGSNSVIVADIDTGADYNHLDLAANIWHNPGEIPNNGIDDDGDGFVDDYYGYDFFNHDPDPMDDHGHGTHTAGTIGAVGNNSLGVAGVNWNIKLMILKTHAANGDASSATVTAAFNYVTMMKNRGINIRVTNNSWGGAPEAAGYDQVLKDAIDAAGNAGVVNVFAAGNDGRDIDASPSYPAGYNSPSIISVAASDASDNRSGFSNWGQVSVALAAPGSNILSTTPNNTYSVFSGTSMATPHVTGAVALLAGLNPGLSVASLKATLMNTADQLPEFSTLVASGGRLNVANALANPTTCNFSLSQTGQNFSASSGAGSVNLTTNSNACSWGAFSQSNWITVTSASGGSGSSTINFTVSANSGGARTGSIEIGGQTITISQDAGSPAPDFFGFLDAAGCGIITGWAWDRNDPNKPVNVDIYVDGQLQATVPATLFRQDLVNAGIGNGYHGFRYTVPLGLKDGLSHTVTVKFPNTGTNLNNTPRTIQCDGTLPSHGGGLEVFNCQVLSGWAWERKDPNMPINLAIYLPLRLSTFRVMTSAGDFH